MTQLTTPTPTTLPAHVNVTLTPAALLTTWVTLLTTIHNLRSRGEDVPANLELARATFSAAADELTRHTGHAG